MHKSKRENSLFPHQETLSGDALSIWFTFSSLFPSNIVYFHININSKKKKKIKGENRVEKNIDIYALLSTK